jgi:hypothetical protein
MKGRIHHTLSASILSYSAWVSSNQPWLNFLAVGILTFSVALKFVLY